MSSVIFQPLLHDSLGWRPSNSTYTDHYKWRKYRSTNKDKKLSIYGRQYKKQQQLNRSLPITLNEEQTINPVIVIKKNEDNQESPIPYRYSSSSKTPVYIVEHKQRPASANENTTCNSKVSQRPPTAPPRVEEKSRSVTAFETHQTPKEESTIDPNNDNNRHWLTYPNPKTPQYLIDIKQRLGQLKIPSTLAQPSSASNASVQEQQQQQQTPPPITRSSSASVQRQQKQETNNDQRHFLTYYSPETPDDLRATRYRIDKHRYNPSLDNYPRRPQTCPVRRNNTPKPITPLESENQQLPPPPPPPPQTPKIDAWIVDEDRKSSVPDIESSSILIQMVDCDGLPNEYVDALETASAAQIEYEKNLKMNPERRPTNPVYRLSETSFDNKSDSFITYQNQQQSTRMNNQLRQVARTSQNDFGVWVRNATDKERASAMKLLQDVLNQPIIGYDKPTKPKTVFKQAPAPPPVRNSSTTRKLGRTRTQHQFPCEICEKLLIKRHVWDLTGSEALNCPHRIQGIQIRA